MLGRPVPLDPWRQFHMETLASGMGKVPIPFQPFLSFLLILLFPLLIYLITLNCVVVSLALCTGSLAQVIPLDPSPWWRDSSWPWRARNSNVRKPLLHCVKSFPAMVRGRSAETWWGVCTFSSFFNWKLCSRWWITQCCLIFFIFIVSLPCCS